MRLRNVKNKDAIMNNNNHIVYNPEKYIGHWKDLFGNLNSIEVEIGIGKGNFLLKKALNNPNINYIGIEKYDSVIVKAIKKIPEGVHNLRLIRMDAINIDKIFDKEIGIMYLNFSDPWPKARHSNRRLTSLNFLKKYEDIFLEKKVIYQRTDNKNLFEFSIVSLNSFNYKIVELSFDLHNSDFFDNITSEYEDKFSSRGNVIYYLKAEK